MRAIIVRMPRKKKTDTLESSGHDCAWSGCHEPGHYKAPRSANALNDYQWFCEEHIREFNRQWDYFRGKTQDEIYEFQKDATIGHRPTWRVDQMGPNPDRKLEEALARMFGASYVKPDAKPIAARDKDALATLDLEHPANKEAIKSQYRELAKKYHPDVNRGNARAEETFKRITHAYQHLMSHYVET